MPDMDGTEATAAIRADERGSGRHVPIIGMSAGGLPGDADAGQAAGMDAYLPKPLDSARLAQTVARLNAANVRAAFDLDAALEMVDGDRDFLRELAELFLQQAPSTVAAMHQAVTLADAATLERLAHRLKSSAISLRAYGVHAAARLLETVAAEGRLSEAAAALDHLHGDCGPWSAPWRRCCGLPTRQTICPQRRATSRPHLRNKSGPRSYRHGDRATQMEEIHGRIHHSPAARASRIAAYLIPAFPHLTQLL
jgi:HPt (histidine-containing phosphotransfer) domain-containing protein